MLRNCRANDTVNHKNLHAFLKFQISNFKIKNKKIMLLDILRILINLLELALVFKILTMFLTFV